MKKLIVIGLVIMSIGTYGQNDQLIKVFNDQIEAFNQKDVNRLVANVTDDFK